MKFLKSVMIWGAVTSAGVGPLCFIEHKVNAAVNREILEHFMLPSADKLYGDADFLFLQDFSISPQCQNHYIYIYIYIYINIYYTHTLTDTQRRLGNQ